MGGLWEGYGRVFLQLGVYSTYSMCAIQDILHRLQEPAGIYLAPFSKSKKMWGHAQLYHTVATRVNNTLSKTYFLLNGTYPPDTYCDPQSTCAGVATQIAALIQSPKPGMQAEIMAMLDYGALLSNHSCHALALLTLQEVHRQMLALRAKEDHQAYLETLQVYLRKHHQPLPVGGEPVYPLSVLLPQYTGRGMQYLEALRKHQLQRKGVTAAAGPQAPRSKP